MPENTTIDELLQTVDRLCAVLSVSVKNPHVGGLAEAAQALVKLAKQERDARTVSSLPLLIPPDGLCSVFIQQSEALLALHRSWALTIDKGPSQLPVLRYYTNDGHTWLLVRIDALDEGDAARLNEALTRYAYDRALFKQKQQRQGTEHPAPPALAPPERIVWSCICGFGLNDSTMVACQGCGAPKAQPEPDETIVGMEVGEHSVQGCVVVVRTSKHRVLACFLGASADASADWRVWRELPPLTQSKKLWPEAPPAASAYFCVHCHVKADTGDSKRGCPNRPGHEWKTK